jgi:hypothetical protein
MNEHRIPAVGMATGEMNLDLAFVIGLLPRRATPAMTRTQMGNPLTSQPGPDGAVCPLRRRRGWDASAFGWEPTFYVISSGGSTPARSLTLASRRKQIPVSGFAAEGTRPLRDWAPQAGLPACRVVTQRSRCPFILLSYRGSGISHLNYLFSVWGTP